MGGDGDGRLGLDGPDEVAAQDEARPPAAGRLADRPLDRRVGDPRDDDRPAADVLDGLADADGGHRVGAADQRGEGRRHGRGFYTAGRLRSRPEAEP